MATTFRWRRPPDYGHIEGRMRDSWLAVSDASTAARGYAFRLHAPVSERPIESGSRGSQRSFSTWLKKISKFWLNKPGSSKFVR